MKNKLMLHFCSNPFTEEKGTEFCRQCVEACDSYGFEFGIQLHNSAPADEIERCVSYGVKLSAHLPLLARHNINLAAADESIAMEELARSVEIMRRHDMAYGVFHGFRMTDIPTLAFNRELSYVKAMSAGFRPELADEPDSTKNRDFTDLEEFFVRRQLVKERLEWLRANYPDLTLCIENDFPSFGSANMVSRDAVFLEHPLCLDTGHLWASCFYFGRDFYIEVESFLASGRVEMVHLHASVYNNETPRRNFDDGHQSLRTPNDLDLPRFVRKCRNAGVPLVVLEIPRGSVNDIHDFAQMWDS